MGRSLLAVNKALWLLKACWLLADICSGLWTGCLLLMAIAETFERLLADGRDSLWCIGFVVLHVFFL